MATDDEKKQQRHRKTQEKLRAFWTPERRKAESEKAKERWKARKAKLGQLPSN